MEVEYTALGELQRRSQRWWQDVLAVVCFDRARVAPPLGDMPSPQIRVSVLGGADTGAEIWRLSGPLESGRYGRVRYRRNERLLFACLCISEAELIGTGVAAADSLGAATAAAYTELFSAFESLGFPHPIRMWNFLPEINATRGGTERYWQFNGARRTAFLGARRSIRGNVPAASALGAEAGSALTVYCIAGVQPPIALENPRQCSAWNYPRRYSPRAPIFARACIGAHASHAGRTLFISGTSSIVGHESAHAGDVAAQTRETIDNIRALVAAANERCGSSRYAAERLRYKVYVRHPQDQPGIERELRAQIGNEPPVLFLQADICRRELLVEIEAVGP